MRKVRKISKTISIGSIGERLEYAHQLAKKAKISLLVEQPQKMFKKIAFNSSSWNTCTSKAERSRVALGSSHALRLPPGRPSFKQKNILATLSTKSNSLYCRIFLVLDTFELKCKNFIFSRWTLKSRSYGQ